MKPITPLKGGGEYDALTRWRRYIGWRPGSKRYWRNKYWKRVRRLWRDRKAQPVTHDNEG